MIHNMIHVIKELGERLMEEIQRKFISFIQIR